MGYGESPSGFEDAVEGEALAVRASCPGVRAAAQEIEIDSVPPISGGKLLFLRFPEVGSWIELSLWPAPADRRGARIRLATARDYGAFRVDLDGRAVADRIDVFSPRLGTLWVECGALDGAPRPRALRIEAVGKNPRSSGLLCGIDAVIFPGTR
jgi:hypothetical protein